jgi:uncharacterized membrane protein YeaQ/YmgE (transglycosylase-associated protein family)
MQIIGAIVIGFIVGLLARFLMPGNDRAGFIVTTVLGIAGSIVASYLGQYLGVYAPGQPAGFLGALVGAVIILAIFHFIRRQSQRPPAQ